jgi:hypothetical protein
MDFLVMPMFNIWVPVLNLPKDQFPCDKQLVENRNYWKKQLDKHKEGADNLLSSPTGGTNGAASSSTAPSTSTTTLPPPSQVISTTAVVPVSVAAPAAEVRLTLVRENSRPPPSSASVAPAPVVGGIQSDRRKSQGGIQIGNTTNRNGHESKMARHDSRS